MFKKLTIFKKLSMFKKLAMTTFFIMFSVLSSWAFSAENLPASPATGLLKMSVGLAIVLGVMALLAWLLKRMLTGVHYRQSVIKIVGGVSVGSRERVVVLEVAGRWIVVGVAPGRVNALASLEHGPLTLADLDLPEAQIAEQVAEKDILNPKASGLAPHFSSWLEKSAAKFLDKK